MKPNVNVGDYVLCTNRYCKCTPQPLRVTRIGRVDESEYHDMPDVFSYMQRLKGGRYRILSGHEVLEWLSR